MKFLQFDLGNVISINVSNKQNYLKMVRRNKRHHYLILVLWLKPRKNWGEQGKMGDNRFA